MEYQLTQTGEQVQNILDQAPTTEQNLQSEITRSTEKDQELETAIGNEKTRAEGVEGPLVTAVGNLETDVEAIKGVIPAQATPSNKLVDKNYVDDAIATNTADFKGTYPSLEALETAVHDANANDYAFVVTTDQDGNVTYSHYKYVEGTGWVFEYALNNSSFTAVQWAAINSGITAALVAKLAGLPNADALVTQMNALIAVEKNRAEAAEGTLTNGLNAEILNRQNADTALQQNIDAEALLRDNADDALQAEIDDIDAKIPTQASASNQLADKAFVNSSIATNTAEFKGTYNSLAELQAVTNVNANDYGFVIATDGTGNTVYNRYKYVEGQGWQFEYALNNSSFTAAQWASIQSGITAALVAKLNGLPDIDALNAMFAAITSKIPANATASNKLVDYAQLVAALAAKQDTLIFDNVPTEGSNNPVKSSGVYTAIATVTAAIVGLQSSKQDVLTFDQYPTAGSDNPVRSTGIYSAIENAVTPKADKTDLDNAVIRISTNEVDIAQLQAAYRGLTQNDVDPVAPTDTWPVANPQENVIYRVVDRTNTPPQYYTDYMWNGTVMVEMAQYNNGIDDIPTPGSNNLVKSGGVASHIVYDISEANAVGGTLATYADLEAALGNNGDNIPPSIQKGGMSVKFVQSSDNNYVQYRFTLSNFTVAQFADIINWRKEGVPVPDVAIVTGKYLNASGSEFSTTASSFAITDYILAVPGTTIFVHEAASANYTSLCFYDANKKFVGVVTGDSTTPSHHNVTLTDAMIPDGAIFFRANIDPRHFKLTTSDEPNYARILIDWKDLGLEEKDISKIDHALLRNDGTIAHNSHNSEWSDYYVTDYFPIGEKVSVLNLFVHSTGNVANVALCFYDENFNFISYLAKETTVTQLTLTANDIPSGAVYGRSPVTVDGQVLLTKNLIEKYNNIPLELAKLNKISYNAVTVINLDGNIVSSSSDTFKTCNYCIAKEGVELINLHRASSYGNIIVYFYDEYFNPISYLSESETYSNLVLDSSNIPVSAKYFRANFKETGYIKNYKSKILNESDIIDLRKNYNYKNVLFDYEAALAMDKGELRSIVETASNGRCTVLYDNEDYPSLMYKIPKISIGALAPALGDLATVHPAFIVDGVEKDVIYMAVFETCLYQGHYVSWFGLSSEGRITISDLRQNISNKGNGWHLETIYERSLLVLLTMNLNTPTPTGNTNKGMSHLKNWEYCQIYNNTLPGSINHEGVIGLKWINGTQPSAWSHNKDIWGIQDVIGGFHEICDLMKLVNGKIYIAADNNFFKKGDDISTFENSWIDTGVAFDYIDDNIVLNTSVSHPMDVQYYVLKTYPQIGCTAQYDALPESLRKKMCLLLMASRLTSSDANPIFGIDGRFGIANHKELCYGVFGGAEEYVASGLGSQITAYPIDDNDTEGHNAHKNMGSRMVYIP